MLFNVLRYKYIYYFIQQILLESDILINAGKIFYLSRKTVIRIGVSYYFIAFLQ